MGTNYYAEKRENVCECCSRYDVKRLHIGKKSWGWAFSFQAYDKNDYGEVDCSPKDLLSWRTWKEFLQTSGYTIVDEYDERVELSEFFELVEKYGSPNFVREDGHKNLNHNVEIRNDPKYQYPDLMRKYNDPLEHWEDEFGYSFGYEEFS